MERRIKSVLEMMEFGELVGLNKSIKTGEFNFHNILKTAIKDKEKEHRKHCAVCGLEIDVNSTSNYTIMFGPEGFKKRASFCAIDCMEYFVNRLKEVKTNTKEIKKEVVEEI